MLEFIELILPLIQAMALTFARPLGFIISFPLFTWLGLEGMARNAVAIVIGSPFVLAVYTQLTAAAVPLPAEYIVLLSGKEFLVGITLGIVMGVPFWGAEMAGAYIDVYRGTSSATVVSPNQMSEPLITGAIFSVAMVAIFLALGGLRVVIGVLYDSYDIWPYFQVLPQITGDLYPVFFDILAEVARISIILGAPILIAMFVGELALAYASRFAPQINIFDAMLSIKNIIFLLILPPYVYLLARYYGPDVLDIGGLVEILKKLGGT